MVFLVELILSINIKALFAIFSVVRLFATNSLAFTPISFIFFISIVSIVVVQSSIVSKIIPFSCSLIYEYSTHCFVSSLLRKVKIGSPYPIASTIDKPTQPGWKYMSEIENSSCLMFVSYIAPKSWTLLYLEKSGLFFPSPIMTKPYFLLSTL